MATLGEEIASLKQVIAEYERDLRNAVTPEDKRLLLEVIKARSENLTRLDKEKHADEAVVLLIFAIPR
jgi:hypothetical protein